MPHKDPAVHKAYLKQHAKERRKRIADFKTGKPCVDCGVIYPFYVTQFDHLSDNKEFSIAKMGNYKWERVLAEIAKCELVCANCHAERTYLRLQGIGDEDA